MTPEELREIDKKVAVELGWVGIGTARGNDREIGFDWMGVAPSGDYLPIPRYSAVANPADRVRQEIERRGWMLTRIDYISKRPLPAYPAQHRAQITEVGISEDLEHWGASDDSPHVALCLAFLQACEAAREEKS